MGVFSMPVGMAAVVLGLAVSFPAAAQSQHTECRGTLPSEASLPFAHVKHLHWYRRFWTGQCANLGAFDFCKNGSPFWNEAVERIGKEAAAAERQQVIEESCRLGHLIGFEWAKDNDKRCIHTKDLPALYGHLQGSGEPRSRIARAKRAAQVLLGCKV